MDNIGRWNGNCCYSYDCFQLNMSMSEFSSTLSFLNKLNSYTVLFLYMRLESFRKLGNSIVIINWG